MNKHILLLLALTACFLHGCNNDDKPVVTIDYGATTSYKVENRSDATIKFIIVYGKINDTDLSRTITILPDEKKEIDSSFQMCGKNYMVPEFQGDVLPIILVNISVDIYADDNKVNVEVLDKENWVFSAEEYYKADYLLVITDELIEQAGYVE